MDIIALAKTLSLAAMLCIGACAHAPEATTNRSATQADNRIDYVAIDDARIRVSQSGDPDNPALILLHGFTMSLESWDGWAETLSDDYYVVRYDLLGHGITGPDPQSRYAAEQRVDVLRALMDELGIVRASIGGNSFGGLVAWQFAERYPGRVDRLILVDSGAYSIFGVTEEPAPVPAMMRAYLSNPTVEAVRMSAGSVYADMSRLPEGRIEQMHAIMARPGNGEAAIAHLEAFTLPDPDARLARISAPTLILWGEEDRLIPIDHGRRLAEAIPDARLITYPGVGHAPQEEIPAQSAADVRAFLSGSGE